MCGFLAYLHQGNNEYIRRRGQDCTHEVKAGGYTFIHNLLSVTGEYTPQPFVDGDIVCLFNGEIYNQPFSKSDGEVIIPLYREFGEHFARQLDGEFAIAIYDFAAGRTVFATDAFATKPFFCNQALECASYASGIAEPLPVPANTTLVFCNGELEKTLVTHPFVWGKHYKDSYDDWIDAFENALRLRARDRCFYGLSSGYDSGAINLVLRRQKVDAKAYSMVRGEDQEILGERLKNTSNQVAFVLSNAEIMRIRQEMPVLTEPFQYRILKHGKWEESNLYDDPAAISMSAICRTGQLEERKVYLSGQGADEVLSDYSLVPQQSQFKGRFPDRLDGPWLNFHSSCMSSYLGKEERIAGSFNIETRYPFLDPRVVQEFLYLSPEYKNRQYKGPITALFQREGYPYEMNIKRGFGV